MNLSSPEHCLLCSVFLHVRQKFSSDILSFCTEVLHHFHFFLTWYLYIYSSTLKTQMESKLNEPGRFCTSSGENLSACVISSFCNLQNQKEKQDTRINFLWAAKVCKSVMTRWERTRLCERSRVRQDQTFWRRLRWFPPGQYLHTDKQNQEEISDSQLTGRLVGQQVESVKAQRREIRHVRKVTSSSSLHMSDVVTWSLM